MPAEPVRRDVSSWLLAIDRRLVYLFVLLALAVPIVFKFTMKPAPLPSAKLLFNRIELLARERDEAAAEGRDFNKIVLVSSDFGPQTRAELYPMGEAVIRHLMIRRLKFAIMTMDPNGTGYTKSIPEKLAREYGLEYGKDWVNFGYKPGGGLLVQQMANNLPGALKTDYKGDPAAEVPCMKDIKDAGNISLVVEITGLVGPFANWISFFANEKARPDMAHGCTSISIPEAFSYLESKQIVGLLEGIAGAAAYNEFLGGICPPGSPQPSADARQHMTSQTVAHLLIVMFVLLGNVGIALAALRARRGGGA